MGSADIIARSRKARGERTTARPVASSHLVAAAVLAIAAVAPMPAHGAIGGLPSLCVFHRLTGLPCPGCGFTRSLVCCLHGRFDLAIIYHPLGPILFAALVWWSIIGIVSFVKSRTNEKLLRTDTDPPLSPLTRAIVKGAPYVGLVLVVGVWIARLAHFLSAPP
jgi:hypothetical protein